MIRYPLAPLIEAMHLSPNQACLVLGLSGSTQQEYRERGVTERVADRLAVKAGLVPYEVWPEMAGDQIAAEAERTRRIDAARKRRRYRRSKTDRAYFVAKAAAYRADHPEYVARYHAQYREQNRPEINARERARYERNRDEILARKRARYAASKAAPPAPVPCTQETPKP